MYKDTVPIDLQLVNIIDISTTFRDNAITVLLGLSSKESKFIS